MYCSKYTEIAGFIYFSVRIAFKNSKIVHYKHGFTILIYFIEFFRGFKHSATTVLKYYCYLTCHIIAF